jgi:hypothetical protein
MLPNGNSYSVRGITTTAATLALGCFCIGGAHFRPQTDLYEFEAHNGLLSVGGTEGSRGASNFTTPFFREYLPPQQSALGAEAAAALGVRGVKRLKAFQQLQPGWDSGRGEALQIDSLRALSSFFEETMLRPPRLSVFMSGEGHLAVSWTDSKDQLIELEFFPDRIEFFIEATGDEGSVPRGDIGSSKLLAVVEAASGAV